MSAFIVSHKHLNTLLSFLNADSFAPRVKIATGDIDFHQVADLQRAAEILLAENMRSVCYRYNETPTLDDLGQTAVAIRFQFQPRRPAIEILKLCACYDYQARETEDYYQTDAAHIVEAIRHTAIYRLPGFNDAEWTIS